MERQFILDKYNTWYDWDLILTSKDVTPPDPKTNYVDIEGKDGTLDLSESLTGEVTYRDRTVKASFWTDHGTRRDRERLLQNIVRILHGKKIRLIEPDDPDHYFYGRVKVTSTSNILPFATFTIEAICDPWRYAINDTVRTIEVENGATVETVIHNNGVKTLCPDLRVTGNVTIVSDDISHQLTAGYYKLADIKLRQGVNVVTVSGDGSVEFTYKEASL